MKLSRRCPGARVFSIFCTHVVVLAASPQPPSPRTRAHILRYLALCPSRAGEPGYTDLQPAPSPLDKRHGCPRLRGPRPRSWSPAGLVDVVHVRARWLELPTPSGTWRQRQKICCARNAKRGGSSSGDDDTVEPSHLDDLLDPVAYQSSSRQLDLARGLRRRGSRSDAEQNSLKPPPVPLLLDHRVLKPPCDRSPRHLGGRRLDGRAADVTDRSR